jgi:uncharacterized membrane protein
MRSVIVLLFGFFSFACASEADEPNPPPTQPGPSSGSTCPSTQTLTYENFGMEFFASFCVRCHSETPEDGSRHGAPRGLDWDEIETVRLHAETIDAMAAAGPSGVNTTMPPSEPFPTSAQRRDLGEWLACGAP